jgi:hypothetical protein
MLVNSQPLYQLSYGGMMQGYTLNTTFSGIEHIYSLRPFLQ